MATEKTKALQKMSRSELATMIDREALPFIQMNERAVAAGRSAPFSNPHLEAIRYELVTKPDGSVEKRKRQQPLLIEIGEVSNGWLVETRQKKTDGERMFSSTKRGKYNDSTMLEICQPMSVDTGDLQTYDD